MKGRKSPAAKKPGIEKPKQPYDNSTTCQRARLIKHFIANYRLTTMEGRDMGIMHPGGRVMELRRQGYLIDTHWANETDSNGVVHRVGMYLYRGKRKEDCDE